jgi:methionine-gamma-lyase
MTEVDKDSKNRKMPTEAVHAGEMHDPSGSHIDPLHMTSTYVFEDSEAIRAWSAGETEARVYSRVGNPNREALARKLAALEGFGMEDPVAAEIFASGMGAVSSALLGFAGSGDHIVAQSVLYGTTNHLVTEVLPKYGITTSRIPLLEPSMLEAELSSNLNTKVVYIETPANPTMSVIDISKTVELAHSHGAKVVVDNTFATPVLQRPLALGADVVVHSTTKFINGHGTVIGGALVSRDPDFIENGGGALVRYMGAVPSAMDCWLTSIGLKTLPLRMREHCSNARALAEFLESHPKVRTTYWPGLESHPQHEIAARQMDDFGAMISIELGGFEQASCFMDGLSMSSLAVSLGNVDTLVQHPASMTHRLMSPEDRRAVGITDGMVRISVGIEDSEDIVADFEGALAGLAND